MEKLGLPPQPPGWLLNFFPPLLQQEQPCCPQHPAQRGHAARSRARSGRGSQGSFLSLCCFTAPQITTAGCQPLEIPAAGRYKPRVFIPRRGEWSSAAGAKSCQPLAVLLVAPGQGSAWHRGRAGGDNTQHAACSLTFMGFPEPPGHAAAPQQAAAPCPCLQPPGSAARVLPQSRAEAAT